MDKIRIEKLCTLLAKVVYETGLAHQTEHPEATALFAEMGLPKSIDHGQGYALGNSHCLRVYMLDKAANRKGLAERARRKVTHMQEHQGKVLYDAVIIINKKRPPNFSVNRNDTGFMITNVV